MVYTDRIDDFPDSSSGKSWLLTEDFNGGAYKIFCEMSSVPNRRFIVCRSFIS